MSKPRKRNLEDKIRALTKCPYCGQLFNYKLFNQHLDIIHGLRTITGRRSTTPTTKQINEIQDLRKERSKRDIVAESEIFKNQSIRPKKILSTHVSPQKKDLTTKSKNSVITNTNIQPEKSKVHLYIKETFKKDNYTIREIGNILKVDCGQIIQLIYKKTKQLLSDQALVPRMMLLKYSFELYKLPARTEKAIKKENNKEQTDKKKKRSKKKEKEKRSKSRRSVRLILIGHPHD